MIVLALDTAGVDCAAAVYDSGTDSVLGEVTETIGRGHAELLMAILDRALAARGFALSLGIPSVGVTTLEIIASAHLENKSGTPVLAAMDAKRGEVYLQSFDSHGHAVGEPMAATLEDAQAIAAGFPGDIVGSGAPLLKGEPPGEASDSFPIAVIARLGARALVGEKPKPLYLRGPDVRPQAGFAVALK